MADLADLRDRIAALTAGHTRPRTIDGVQVYATTRTTAPIGSVAEPVVALVAQGAKRTLLGDRAFGYAAGQFLVVTIDLPLTGHITAASDEEPFLGASLRLDPAVIAQLLLESHLDAGMPAAGGTGPGGAGLNTGGPALAVSEADPGLIDSFARLLALAGSPVDRRILGPAVRREIHWRLLTGPQGGLVRQIGVAGSRVAVVSRAIAWLREHYDQVIRIEDLAAEVSMSVSSLNRHFRAATSMSPLQYQKQIRLQRARARLLADPGDIAGTGHAVGYTSASQFTREYRRLFGAPPGQDAARLRHAHLEFSEPGAG
jgi:AraC-like DNA-binding protein